MCMDSGRGHGVGSGDLNLTQFLFSGVMILKLKQIAFVHSFQHILITSTTVFIQKL